MVVIFIKAIILAAGIGSRLRPLTLNKPKCMVKVDGIPIIEHQIQAYINSGLEKDSIYVVVGYKSEIVINFIKENYNGINIIKNKDFLTTNNMYSLNLVLNNLLIDNSDIIFISNGDCVYDPSIINDLKINDEKNLIACDEGLHNMESMKIRVNDGKIVDISKEISEADSFGASIDLYKMNSVSLLKLKNIVENYIEKQNELNLWTEIAIKDLFSQVIFKPYDITGRKWVEIDNLDDLAIADLKFSGLNLNNKKCFIMDLDGTVYIGNKPITGTINFINKYINDEIDFYFLTNNTSKLPDDYVKNLRKMGIDVQENKIITPIYPLLDYLNENNITKLYFVANKKFVNYFNKKLKNMEITENPEECEAVILAYDTELTYEKIKTASILLQKNKEIKFLATHIDMFCPTENGNIPDIGTITLVIEKTTGRKPDMVFGKPNKIILDNMLNEYKNTEVIIVGDRLKTDKKLADNLNHDFICVLSGETKRSEVEILNAEEYPSLVIKDLGELL